MLLVCHEVGFWIYEAADCGTCRAQLGITTPDDYVFDPEQDQAVCLLCAETQDVFVSSETSAAKLIEGCGGNVFLALETSVRYCTRYAVGTWPRTQWDSVRNVLRRIRNEDQR